MQLLGCLHITRGRICGITPFQRILLADASVI